MLTEWEEAGEDTCRKARMSRDAGIPQSDLTIASNWGFPGPFGRENARRRTVSGISPAAWLSRQRQTLSLPVWEGIRSYFHFTSYSSRTVSHRLEKLQKQDSPSSTTASRKQELTENTGKNTLDLGRRATTKAFFNIGERVRRSTDSYSLLSDLGQGTDSLCLQFFSSCQMKTIKTRG